MPVFDAETIRELIANDEVAGVTLDSNAIFSFGRSGNLRHPLLTALGSLRQRGVRVLLSDVVARESEGHFVRAMMEQHGSVADALKRLSRLGGTTKEATDAALAALPDAAAQEDIVRSEYAGFLSMIGAEILKADDHTSVGSILDLYFDARPPFANPDKKAEFPDAIALTSLQTWSEENGHLVLVSADKDWRDFAAKSDTLHVSSELRLVLASFQEDDALAAKVVASFKEGNDVLVDEIRKAIQRSVDDLDFYVDYDTDWMVEVQPEQVIINAIAYHELADAPEITGSDATSLTLSLPVSTKLRLIVDASFSVTDPIDRDEVPIGSSSISIDFEHDFVVAVVVAGKGEEELEIIEASVTPDTRLSHVDLGYVGFERYHDEENE